MLDCLLASASREKLTLDRSQADVGLNLYDFYVRVPGRPTRKYKMRIYDDVILAPYVRNLALLSLTEC